MRKGLQILKSSSAIKKNLRAFECAISPLSVARLPAFSMAPRRHFSSEPPKDPAPGPQGQPQLQPKDFIIEVTEQNIQALFTTDIKIPMILDFYASWCEPCKTLGPILEELTIACAGRVVLLKINADTFGDVAQQLQVSQLPTVISLVNKRPVGRFTGALSEDKVKEFFVQALKAAGLDIPPKLASSDPPSLLARAKDLLETPETLPEALTIFSQILGMPQAKELHPSAIAGLALHSIKLHNLDTAEQLINTLKNDYKIYLSEPFVHQALSAYDLAMAATRASAASQSLDTLRADVEKNPTDPQLRLDLASALFEAGQHKEAFDHGFELVKKHRKWEDEAGKKLVLKFIEVLGPKNDVAVAARKRLANLIF